MLGFSKLLMLRKSSEIRSGWSTERLFKMCDGSSGICRIISSYSWIRSCDNEKNPAKYNWSTQKNNNDSAAMLNFQQLKGTGNDNFAGQSQIVGVY